MSYVFEELAHAIDASCESQDEPALRSFLVQIAAMDRAHMSAPERAAVAFYEANIFAALRAGVEAPALAQWYQPLLEKEIRALRLARGELADQSTPELGHDLKLRILTNLANALNRCGRVVEAVELWDEVLAEHPRFGMAMGNKALALYWHARYMDDALEQGLLLQMSHRTLKAALLAGVESHAQVQMEELVDHLGSVANWDEVEIAPRPFRSGPSKQERRYRRWCVEHRVVLSPINDVCLQVQSLQDTLTLPAITVLASETTGSLPRPYAIFNQLKQEYVSARFLIFEALSEKGDKVHYADKGVILFDTLDYRYYRTWIEKLKMAFLAVHAIFDKIAYLINDYWKLGLSTRRATFSSVWYTDGLTDKGVSPKFVSSQNWPLRGLYWLSRDFHIKPAGEGAVDPEARVLRAIRNHIAHKYLRVHDHFLYGAKEDRARNDHELGYPISDSELEEQVIKLLKLARSALVCLTCAVAHEESDRKKAIGKQGVFPMEIPVVHDSYRL